MRVLSGAKVPKPNAIAEIAQRLAVFARVRASHPCSKQNTMTEPTIVQREPYEQELQPGTYWWCACGRSQNQPFCDGSHQGTGMEPVSFTINKPSTVWLCGCKHTRHPPFCDGAHNQLP